MSRNRGPSPLRSGTGDRPLDARSGVALVIALAVLTALFLMGVPFAVFMRMQHSAGTQAIETAQARFGQAGAVDHTRRLLSAGVREEEQSGSYPEPFDNYEVDTLREFATTLRTRVTGYTVEADTSVLSVARALGVPCDDSLSTVDGYVRVADEWLGYVDATVQADGTGTLIARNSDHRGLFGTVAAPHSAGELVSFFPREEFWHLAADDEQARVNINTASWQALCNVVGYAGVEDSAAMASGIYIGRYEARPDSAAMFNPYQSVSMIRQVAAVSADDYDRIRPYLTVSSSTLPGQKAWGATGSLQTDVPPAGGGYPGSGKVADLSSGGEAVAPFSVVRFRWGNQEQFRTVLAKNVDGVLAQDYDGSVPGEMRLEWVEGFVGASATMPCYVRIGDEWLKYDGAAKDEAPDPDELVLSITQRGSFGSTPNATPIVAGTAVNGDVICWEYGGASPVPPLTGALNPAPAMSDSPVIQVQSRHAVNINTVDNDVVLRALIGGITDGTDTLDDTDAANVANYILWYTSGDSTEHNFFNGNEDWIDGVDESHAGPSSDVSGFGAAPRDELNEIIDQLVTDNALTAGEGELLKRAFDVDSPGAWPAWSTAPVRFESGRLSRFASIGVVDDRAGTPVAVVYAKGSSNPGADQVVDPLPPEPIWVMLRSQKEFQEHIGAGDSANVITHPLDTGLAPAVLLADPDERYTDTGPGVGTVTTKLGETETTAHTTVIEGLHGGPSFDLDSAVGTADEQGGATATVDTVTNAGFHNVSLEYATDYHTDGSAPEERNFQADSFYAALQPFAVECWLRMPTADDEGGTIAEGDAPQFILDLGAGLPDESATDQVRLYVERATGDTEVRLVLRLDDEIGNGYVICKSSDAFDLVAGNWYHVCVAVVGTFRDQVAMFIDGIYDRGMSWAFVSGGTSHGPEGGANAVDEGYYWPVGMKVPNVKYTVAVPPSGGTWPDPGLPANIIGVTSVAGLPPKGFLSITSTDHVYEYSSVDAGSNRVTLVNNLGEAHSAGAAVAVCIPVIQTVRSEQTQAATALPASGQEIAFYAHTNLTNNADDTDAFGGPLTIVNLTSGGGGIATGDVITEADEGISDASLEPYTWLAISPNSFPLGGAGGPSDFDAQALRWKVRNTTSDNLLTGVLPCDAGTDFFVGSDVNGANKFAGLIDEFRIAALPVVTVDVDTNSGDGEGWTSGQSDDGYVKEWYWYADPGMSNWVRAATRRESFHALADALGARKLWDGGYFLVEGCVYSYQQYTAAALISGIFQANDDLTDTGTQSYAETHEPNCRLVPLTCFTTSRLSAAVSDSEDEIGVEDVTQFPAAGYVRIEDEVIAYNSRDVANSELERTPPFPRGAFNTAPAAHDAADTVRLLPVRFLDRYRADDDRTPPVEWDQHTTYSDADLSNEMCMLNFRVDIGDAELRTIFWEFVEPLEAGQKVIVLVNLDGDAFDPNTWHREPNDGNDGTDPGVTQGDLFWGWVIEGPGEQRGARTLYERNAGTGELDYALIPPDGFDVRFYFDLGSADLYNTGYGGSTPAPQPGPVYHMAEIDTVGAEVMPQ